MKTGVIKSVNSSLGEYNQLLTSLCKPNCARVLPSPDTAMLCRILNEFSPFPRQRAAGSLLRPDKRYVFLALGWNFAAGRHSTRKPEPRSHAK